MAQVEDKTTVRLGIATLAEMVRDILAAVGVPEDDRPVIADALIDADRRGLHSHGLLRLPLYVSAVKAGGIDPDPRMTWRVAHGAVATLDAASGFGQVAMWRAVGRARQLTEQFGSAAIAVYGSIHYGAGAYWTELLAESGYASFLTSTTGIVVAPFGSARKILGTNPMTLTFPAGGAPLTADLATSAGAYGKIVQAARTNEPIPGDWAVDVHGRPTTNAQAALDGAVRPFGGHKGSAIATMLELFAAAGTGARFANETTDIWIDPASRMGTGHLLLTFDPEVLAPGSDPQGRASRFRDELHDLPAADDASPVLAPGDVERRRAEGNRDEVTVPGNVARQLDALASELGVSLADGLVV